MRLVIAATVVVAGFVVGVLCIARLTEDSPAWLRLTRVTIWLFAIIAGAFLLGNKRQRRSEHSKIQVRDSLLYMAIALVFVSFAVAVIVHDV